MGVSIRGSQNPVPWQERALAAQLIITAHIIDGNVTRRPRKRNRALHRKCLITNAHLEASKHGLSILLLWYSAWKIFAGRVLVSWRSQPCVEGRCHKSHDGARCNQNHGSCWSNSTTQQDGVRIEN